MDKETAKQEIRKIIDEFRVNSAKYKREAEANPEKG